MRGTWQGSGTWQSSGPDLDGLIVPVIIAAVFVAVVEFVLSIIVWLALAAGIVLVLAVAALVVWRVKAAPKRRAAEAAITAAFVREAEARRAERAITGTVLPQVSWPDQPAITNNYGPQFHIHGPDAEAQLARVIRSALPGQAGGPVPEGESS
jgi:hypothetical protein